MQGRSPIQQIHQRRDSWRQRPLFGLSHHATAGCSLFRKCLSHNSSNECCLSWGRQESVLRMGLPLTFASHDVVAISLHGFAPSAAPQTMLSAIQALPLGIRVRAQHSANGVPPPRISPKGNHAASSVWLARAESGQMARPLPPSGSDGDVPCGHTRLLPDGNGPCA